MPDRLGIITGSGELAKIAVSEAVRQKYNFKVYLTDASLKLPSGEFETQRVLLEKFGRLLSLLKKDKITHLVIAGKMYKEILLRNIVFDLKALSLIRKMKNKNDHNLYSVIASEVEKKGMKILPQSYLLSSCLATEKIYSEKKPAAEDRKDIEFGMETAAKAAELDIGQTVVVSRQIILAVEAVEGTDEAIRRGGKLAKTGRATVCKASRRSQDSRFDIPTVGPSTIDAMKKAGCGTLAFEAGRTLIIQEKRMVEKAKEAGIVIVSVNSNDFILE